ncbi:DUF5985 family protein [Pseudoduganella aquatica]|jgi:hypothetical protein|uniref:Uncharacterized protein n=1 Tax=Pseudoduganella aquatica TaxID=2660641 RepID=A0A7X4KML1_9BURK|nr:DUF5985 family protein [Pseudoduganella aquatica]MYN07945.1 hypothetical protein [Pseudoduganella aquatica]
MAVNSLLSGAIVMAALVAALFFLRFWRQTRDRFFLYFAVAFMLEALHRLLWALAPLGDADAPLYYLIRLASYVLILVAIINKNRAPPR